MIRLAVRARADDAERVLAALVELAPSGVEQVDGPGWVEYAVYGAPGELPSLPPGEIEVAGALVQVSGREVADDWADRWRQFHHPILIGGRLWVRPPWEQQAVRPGVAEVVIDPGRAFGTGSHATTRLSLELLLEVEPDGSVCDLGCGSGVLAIAAAKLGFRPVSAVDADPLAVEATRRNAAENGVALDHVGSHDLRHVPAPEADVVLANLMRPLLLRVAELMRKPPRVLVVSGLLEEEADEVAGAIGSMYQSPRQTQQGRSALLLNPS
jgi:ribosomal protein L11 methyltransferase